MKLFEKGSVQVLITWIVILIGCLMVNDDAMLNMWLKGMGCLFTLYALWGNYPALRDWHQDIVMKWGDRKGRWLAWALWAFLLPGVIFATWILVPFAFVFSLPLIKGLSQLWVYSLPEKVGYGVSLVWPFLFALWRMPAQDKRAGYRWWLWFFHFSWTFILSGIVFFAIEKMI